MLTRIADTGVVGVRTGGEESRSAGEEGLRSCVGVPVGVSDAVMYTYRYIPGMNEGGLAYMVYIYWYLSMQTRARHMHEFLSHSFVAWAEPNTRKKERRLHRGV